MHALGVLGHEATHYLFLKNRKWNDFITNVTCMYPLFNSIENYRTSHFYHHQYTNTSEDPDWVAKENKEEYEFPKNQKAFFFTLVMYVFFIQGIRDIRWMLQRIKKSNAKQTLSLEKRVLKISFYFLLVLLLTISGGWIFYLAFWLVPFSTFFFLFMYIRSVAEHFALSRECLLTSTRTIKASLLERFLFSPHNVGYHLEHHLYPSVPFYNAAELHQLLMKDTEYASKAHITYGYLAFLKELN